MNAIDAALRWLNRDHAGSRQRAIQAQQAREYAPEVLTDSGDYCTAGCDSAGVCLSTYQGGATMLSWAYLEGQ